MMLLMQDIKQTLFSFFIREYFFFCHAITVSRWKQTDNSHRPEGQCQTTKFNGFFPWPCSIPPWSLLHISFVFLYIFQTELGEKTTIT